MELVKLQNVLKSIKKGTYVNVEYKTYLKTNKLHKDEKVYKLVSSIVRVGIKYSNISSVIQKKALEDKINIPASLPYGEWMNGWENYLITHKDKIQLRMSLSKGAKHKPKVLGYFKENDLGASEITQEQAKELTIPSIWNKNSEPSEIFNKNIDDIIEIKNISNYAITLRR